MNLDQLSTDTARTAQCSKIDATVRSQTCGEFVMYGAIPAIPADRYLALGPPTPIEEQCAATNPVTGSSNKEMLHRFAPKCCKGARDP